MATTWLQQVKVRAFLSTPVSGASRLSRKVGIRLQTWRRTLNLCGRWSICFFFFITAPCGAAREQCQRLFQFGLWDATVLESEVCHRTAPLAAFQAFHPSG